MFIGTSPTADSLKRPGVCEMTQVSPKQQLQYLADVLGFKIQYTDFPKVRPFDYHVIKSLYSSLNVSIPFIQIFPKSVSEHILIQQLF